jgi:serine phosphatase RsbU (regulator of sigma subunit)
MTAMAGDFYDFPLPGKNRLGILIADVSGHGVPAALIASMVKVAIAAQLPHANNPGRVLSGMNRVLCGNMQASLYPPRLFFWILKTGCCDMPTPGIRRCCVDNVR